jgi:hypothetical protein
VTGFACTNPAEHRPAWVVVARRCNYSAFNGYRWTPSDYSEVRCTRPDCLGRWRTKAKYVDALPDALPDAPPTGTVS